jgi:hypothetical protein
MKNKKNISYALKAAQYAQVINTIATAMNAVDLPPDSDLYFEKQEELQLLSLKMKNIATDLGEFYGHWSLAVTDRYSEVAVPVKVSIVDESIQIILENINSRTYDR